MRNEVEVDISKSGYQGEEVQFVTQSRLSRESVQTLWRRSNEQRKSMAQGR